MAGEVPFELDGRFRPIADVSRLGLLLGSAALFVDRFDRSDGDGTGRPVVFSHNYQCGHRHGRDQEHEDRDSYPIHATEPGRDEVGNQARDSG